MKAAGESRTSNVKILTLNFNLKGNIMKRSLTPILAALALTTTLYSVTSQAHPTNKDKTYHGHPINTDSVGVSGYKRNHNKFILSENGNMVNVDIIAYTKKTGDVVLISGEVLEGIFPSQSAYEILQRVYGAPDVTDNKPSH